LTRNVASVFYFGCFITILPVTRMLEQIITREIIHSRNKEVTAREGNGILVLFHRMIT